MAAQLGHERQLSFFPEGGHDHDGVNSTPVKLLPGTVNLEHLSDSLLGWLDDRSEGGEDLSEGDVVPVKDLVIETPAIAPGGYFTGSTEWTTMCAVRFVRILMTVDTECTITFYHKGTYADEDREFRATNCGNKFLWEGAWIHYDEDQAKKVYYRIENTGNTSASFQITVKSGTMAANTDARYIDAITSSGVEVTGTVDFVAGPGVTIEADTEAQNVVISAGDIETVPLGKWALNPIKPTAVTSSTTLSSNGGSPIAYLQDGYTHDTARYINVGSGAQWIQVDTGAVRNFGAVQVILYFADRIHYGVKIDVSADGTSWTTIMASVDIWATGEGTWVHMPSGILARYVRVYLNGTQLSASNHIVKIIPYAISDKG